MACSNKVDRYKALSDDDLVLLLKRDDERALSSLYLRYWDKMLSVATHRLDDPKEAEEVVQDVFCSLWQRRASLEIKYTIGTYLAVAVKYKIINVMAMRATARNREKRMPAAPQFELSAEEYIFEKELWESIERTVRQLPKKCQVVFRLSREQGLSHKQISSELGISEKTVEAHISKAIKEIKRNLAMVAPAILIAEAGIIDTVIKLSEKIFR